MMKKHMRRLACLIFGCRPISGLFEDDEIISNKGCSRCGHPFMTFRSRWKGMRECRPKWWTPKEYEQLCDDTDEEARKEFRGNNPLKEAR